MSRLTFGTTPITFPKQYKRGGTFMITQLAILQGKWKHRHRRSGANGWIGHIKAKAAQRYWYILRTKWLLIKKSNCKYHNSISTTKSVDANSRPPYKSLFSLLTWPPYCISAKHCLRPQHSVITRLQYNSRCGYLWNDKTCHQRMSCKSDIPQLRQPHMLEAVHA